MAIKMKMNTSNAYAILVREAPAQQAGLEFFKNALEAVGSTFLTISSIKIKSGFKAVFHNDGKGLDEKTMKDLAEVFGDPNIENGKTDENYNTGARLIGMKTNELGIVFISQHDGVIRSTRTFVRDGEALAEFDEPEYTTLFRREKRDWVRVVLLGNSWSQPTFRKPYGNLTGLEPFLEQFLFRFYSLGKVQKSYTFLERNGRQRRNDTLQNSAQQDKGGNGDACYEQAGTERTVRRALQCRIKQICKKFNETTWRTWSIRDEKRAKHHC